MHRLPAHCQLGTILLTTMAAAAYGQLPALPGSGSKLLSADSQAPKVGVKLMAAQTAAAPGGRVDLGIEFDIPKGWHIYWSNRGEGGLETKFDWKLPEGYSVGPMRFPPPARHIDETDAHTFILEHQPIILTTLSVPASAKPSEKAAIAVDVSWLACQKSCFPGEKSLSVELPIVADAKQAKPANAADFDYAIEQLPVAPAKARHIRNLRAVAAVDRVRPGDQFKLAVVF